MSVPASMTVPVIRSVEDLERLHFGHAAESEAKLVSTLTESGLVEPEALDRRRLLGNVLEARCCRPSTTSACSIPRTGPR